MRASGSVICCIQHNFKRWCHLCAVCEPWCEWGARLAGWGCSFAASEISGSL